MLSPESLEKLVTQQRYQAGAWEVVLHRARRVGQMRAFSTYINDSGNVINVGNSQQARYLEMFEKDLQFAIDDAVREDAMMGAALAVAKE